MIARYTVVTVSSNARESALVVVERESALEAAGAATEIATAKACTRAKTDGKRTPAAWRAVAVLGAGAVDCLAGHEGHHGTIHRDPLTPAAAPKATP